MHSSLDVFLASRTCAACSQSSMLSQLVYVPTSAICFHLAFGVKLTGNAGILSLLSVCSECISKIAECISLKFCTGKEVCPGHYLTFWWQMPQGSQKCTMYQFYTDHLVISSTQPVKHNSELKLTYTLLYLALLLILWGYKWVYATRYKHQTPS